MNKPQRDKTTCGRPPKFNEERRPVTVTLPKRILELLAAVDGDRARAIARVTETAVGTDRPEQRRVELLEIGPEQCVLVVGQSEHLRSISWLRLVEIAPARNLLIIPPGTPIETLEIALLDLLENAVIAPGEESMLQELRRLISRLRKANRITKGELIFFATKPTPRPSTAPTA